MKPRILVHICCAPDGLYVGRCLQETYRVSGFFYNPNIHPYEEYQRRFVDMKTVAQDLTIDLLAEDYDEARWFRLTNKFKNEPEKGWRCNVCYALRLERTARKAADLGFDAFTTVMSLSPWKKAQVINNIGLMFGRRYRVSFLEADFKKKDGFKKSVELSRLHGLHRQDYCGCVYSRR